MNSAPEGNRSVRVVHGATTTSGPPPTNAILYQVHYPARFSADPDVVNTGVLPPVESDRRWPIVVWLGGVNINIDGYRWLARILGHADVAMVTFAHVGETTPGDVGLSPGIDLGALTVESYGSRPSSTTIGPLIDALRKENDSGLLAGRMDLDDITLGGHSAGGTLALLNANPHWFPGVRGAVSYAGHTMPAAPLGHPAGTVLRPEPAVPVLLLAGTEDSVIAASRGRYLQADAQHDPVAATFDHGATEPGSAFVEISGAGHLSICHPLDDTSGRGFLEDFGEEDSRGTADHRDLIGLSVLDFVRRRATSGPSSGLESLSGHPLVSRFHLR